MLLFQRRASSKEGMGECGETAQNQAIIYGEVKLCSAVKAHRFILPCKMLIEFALAGITIALFLLKKHKKASDSVQVSLTECI